MTPGAPPAPPLSVAVAAVESALRVGEGLEVSLCLTAEADFSLSGTTARAGLQASWQLASAAAAAAPATEETPSAAAPAPGSGVTAPGMTPAAAPAQEAGPVPAQEKSTDTAPLLTEAAGRWLPAPLALLLTPGQASSLRVELALRPGERPVLALETLQADAGAVRLRGQGTLELATAAEDTASEQSSASGEASTSAAVASSSVP